MAWAVFVAALAGLLLWLSGAADETISGLHASADRESLRLGVTLPDRPKPPKPVGGLVTAIDGEEAKPVTKPPPEPMEPKPANPEPAADAESKSDSDAAAENDTGDESPPPVPGDEQSENAQEVDADTETQMALVEPPAPEAGSTLDSELPAWLANSRPFDANDERPRIAIIVTDLGLSAAATQIAIQDLPGEVTLAFAAHASGLETWIPQSRAAGHEALVMVPMEPEGYPGNDPGPYTLLTALAPSTNIDRLDWSLRRATNFVGIIDTKGSRFTTITGAITPIIEELGNRGLMVVDSGSNDASVIPAVAAKSAVPIAANDSFITDFASGDAIDLRLTELEAIAADRGWAVGVAFPYPILFERLKEWIGSLEQKGLTLAPVTAVAQKTE